jgi:RimJ/RimL family protein N-acetyltransferase
VSPPALRTPRLKLVAATAALVRAEAGSLGAFARQLGAIVPREWPPELMLDALPYVRRQLERDPGAAGWLSWYLLLRRQLMAVPVLVGTAGFKGLPDADGTVEIGYSVLPRFHNRGYATEGMAELLAWAFAHPQVERVVADVSPANSPSLRVLAKLGFQPAGDGVEPGTVRFELQSRGARRAWA